MIKVKDYYRILKIPWTFGYSQDTWLLRSCVKVDSVLDDEPSATL